MRDDLWLREKLSSVWGSFFADIERKNNVIIRFKGKWKTKFGHIKLLKNNVTEIAVNGLFKDERIPESIIILTIAHELVHYSHGFNSPHEKKFKYPHQGGIVRKELVVRGFKNSLKEERHFIKNKWPEIVKEEFPMKVRHRGLWKLF